MKFKYFAIVVSLLGMLVSPFTESFAAYNNPDPNSVHEMTQYALRQMKAQDAEYAESRTRLKNLSSDARILLAVTDEDLYGPKKYSWYRTIYEGITNGFVSIIDYFEEQNDIALFNNDKNTQQDLIRTIAYGKAAKQYLIEERLEYNTLYEIFYLIGQISIFLLPVLLVVFAWIAAKRKHNNANKKKQSDKPKVRQTKLTPFKVEIVNDEKYINLKQNKRIEFLHNLKKQTAATLTKQHKELETEVNKLKDVPADVAKYIKPKDTSALKDNISKLEYKLMAIDELLSAETGKTKQQKKSSPKNYVDDEEL